MEQLSLFNSEAAEADSLLCVLADAVEQYEQFDRRPPGEHAMRKILLECRGVRTGRKRAANVEELYGRGCAVLGRAPLPNN